MNIKRKQTAVVADFLALLADSALRAVRGERT